MSEEDQPGSEAGGTDEGVPIEVDTDPDDPGGPRRRLEAEADKAVAELDTRLIDILSWVLDTETRGRIYVYLRKHPWSTSEEVAEGTGLYPSTVREALAELAEETVVDRRKRESEGAGNNPYEYMAIPPSELVGTVVGRVQEELNTIFTMEREAEDHVDEPVRIEVADETDETESEGGVSTGGDEEATEGSGESDEE
jgi:predicted transcriptional regulator